MRIRRAESRDLLEIVEIGKISFPYIKDPYTFFLRRINEGNVYVLVEGNIVGFVDFSIEGDEIKLEGIAVLPELRGRGYGRKLMEFFLRHVKELGAKRVYLMTLESNKVANSLYSSFGFVPFKREGPFVWYERYL